MGKCIIIAGSNGGIDPDELTAEASDVLKGKIAGIKGKDEPVAGTLELNGTAADSQVLFGQTYYNTDVKTKRTGSMANKGAVSQVLNAGGSYTVPAGYHNGSGKVTVNSLSSQTSATATARHILSGQTAWVNGSKVTGSIANRAGWTGRIGVNGKVMIPEGHHNGQGYVDQSIPTMGGQTITPGASQQTVSCSGKYMTGNIVIKNVAPPPPDCLKKGYSYMGITGTWEGYVPTATDLYLRGNNIAGWSSNRGDARFDSGQITFDKLSVTPLKNSGIFTIATGKSYNLNGYSKINIQVYDLMVRSDGTPYIHFMCGMQNLASISINSGEEYTQTFSFDISKWDMTGLITFEVYTYNNHNGWSGSKGIIYHIWLS